MPTITMWETGQKRCVLIVAERRYRLELRVGDEIVRTERTKSADAAILLARVWAGEADVRDHTSPPGQPR